MTYNFDEVFSRKGTNSVKYDEPEVPAGTIPLWVADMDFRTPEFIKNAIAKELENPVLGYTMLPDGYYQKIADWVYKLHGWKVDAADIRYVPGIVKGIGIVLACFCKPGDGVVIQPPVYHPFRIVPEKNGYDVLRNPLIPVYDDGEGLPEDAAGKDKDRVLVRYRMDYDGLERIIAEKHPKVLVLANPHNPAGINWTAEELRHLADITSKAGMIVISDEIHAEMVHGGEMHIPYASVSDAARSNAITFMAPTKTFNLAGVVSSYSIVSDPALKEKFYRFHCSNDFNEPHMFAPAATLAAYSAEGECWRAQMMEYIEANIDFVDNYLKTNIPQIRCVRPEASFLIWLDCRSLGMEQKDLVSLFEDKAKLFLNDGSMFGKEGTGFMRLNIGCPRSVLEQALSQLAGTLKVPARPGE